MFKNILAASVFCCFTLTVSAQFEPFQNDETYSVFMDLTAVKDDRLPVQIVPPVLGYDSVEFHMPKIVPGTYAIEDYGQFVSELKATDARGNALEIKQLDTNRWRVYKAKKLYKISYYVEDTYDSEKDFDIFEPAGTSVEDSVFLLNNFGFIGYVDGYKDHPFDLQIAHQAGFYPSTSLPFELGDSLDSFKADNYFVLHDNPILYCVPDTATKMVGGAEVMVSVYSPNRTISAASCMERIAAVLDAAAVYLGGTLPVNKYSVLVYCVPMSQAGNSYGALEHHTSTVLYMPEFPGETFYGGVRDITSHEFFHIVTPLNIHSEYVADFNFIEPQMSAHIWLYEGVTEYNSHLVQIRSNIYDMDEFLDIIREKLKSNDKFDSDIPLTVSSKFTIDYFKDQYYNFYQKGAIAGMALDLKLRELSDSEYGLVDLLLELGETYGVDTFFQDNQLFDIITEMTYPEMREFFARHYEGVEPFPLEELFALAGIEYQREYSISRISSGNLSFSYNFETERLRVEDVNDMDAFGRELGFREGDELIEFNGEEVKLSNVTDILNQYYESTEVGDKVKVKIARPDGDGGFKEKTLKAKAIMGNVKRKHDLEVMENPTPAQLKMRKAWINQ
ncbi:MAG TPA: peptidase M61 [Cryomorphaceae bacterium]|nr:peptidase M61 [Owenweeksia sp.]MBF99931.1 peptidase M61 [Owenweeksia sp.]HAD97440.1 peptidase M61 [Cryomorphaceae bacterium]HCQ16168.1 peptidase M61 [Cryomorphaceae bacterium]|tara:strand:+ start:11368 stop:13221 length:1854 start_codon:yes stop_codon:yes gene_type:complete